jgi:hypothetical protein
MSAGDLVRQSRDLGIKCQEFAAVYHKLINKFKSYNAAPEMDELESYWGIAVKFLSIQGVVGEMIVYFLKYKDLIMASKVDELLAIDYTKEIKSGTNTKTVQLINTLIAIFKHSWEIATTKDQILIKMYIQTLTSKSVIIKSLMDEIDLI